MEKTVNLKDNTLSVNYKFSNNHLKTLITVFSNHGVAEFENRDKNLYEDVDGNEICWWLCDDLVEMGLLDEDEESFDVFYEINDFGKEIVVNFQ